MKISATSALVLNWTDEKLWQSPETLAYSNQLDLSEGEELFKLFSEKETFMHLQSVSGRKYFMKQKVLCNCSKTRCDGLSGQGIGYIFYGSGHFA